MYYEIRNKFFSRNTQQKSERKITYDYYYDNGCCNTQKKRN